MSAPYRDTFPPNRRYSSSADLYAAEDSPRSHAAQLAMPPTPDSDEEGDGFGGYADFKPRPTARYSQAASTLVSSPSYAKLDLVEQPMLSKQDWQKGEGQAEYRQKDVARRATGIQAGKSASSWVARRLRSARQHWKLVVIAMLSSVIVLALVLFFTIPRFPSVDFASDSPLISTDNSPYVSAAAGNFSFISDLHVEINAEDSYTPVQFSTFHVELRLLETGDLVAQGPRTGLKVSGRKKTVYAIPLTWEGSYGNSSDPTFAAIASSCATKYQTTVRDTLNLTMTVQESLVGRIGWSTTEPVTVRGVECPVAFPSNAN